MNVSSTACKFLLETSAGEGSTRGDTTNAILMSAVVGVVGCNDCGLFVGQVSVGCSVGLEAGDMVSGRH